MSMYFPVWFFKVICLQICKHIEEHQYLEAGLVFLRAKASFTEIQNSEKEGTDLFAQYPFLHHRWVRALSMFVWVSLYKNSDVHGYVFFSRR